MMSINLWGRLHFWLYILKYKSCGHETWTSNRYNHKQYFLEMFCLLWRLGAEIRSILIQQPIVVNQKPIKIVVFNFLEGVHWVCYINRNVYNKLTQCQIWNRWWLLIVSPLQLSVNATPCKHNFLHVYL